MRVFLDANILFSAAQPRSRMRSFLALLLKHAECVTNDYAVEEARRNLELKFPSALPDLAGLVGKCKSVPSLLTDLDVDLNEKDLPIMAGAIAGQATHLLTGDEQHLGPLFGNTVHAVKVVSPKMLADDCARRGWL